MSKANPYADLLEGRPAQTVLEATPEALRALLAEIGEANLETRPAPGKWSPAEIVCHLADCDVAFGFRLRQALAEDNPTVQPFNQDKWAANYLGISAQQALEAFTALRRWNLRLIEAALPAGATRTMTHPQRGTLTFRDFVELIAGHDLNHLGQLRRIADAARAAASQG
jgi:hypothetical protein